MAKNAALLVAALILLGAYALFFGGEDDSPRVGFSGRGVPDPYYLELKPADVQNPDDVIRYASSIKGYSETWTSLRGPPFTSGTSRATGSTSPSPTPKSSPIRRRITSGFWLRTGRAR